MLPFLNMLQISLNISETRFTTNLSNPVFQKLWSKLGMKFLVERVGGQEATCLQRMVAWSNLYQALEFPPKSIIESRLFV